MPFPDYNCPLERLDPRSPDYIEPVVIESDDEPDESINDVEEFWINRGHYGY